MGVPVTVLSGQDAASGGAGITTPDRRVRVFVSSTLQELLAERRVVRTAIAGLRLTPVMFELGARPHPPRDLYRAYLAQSDVFVGIYWHSYGWVAPGEQVSGLEDEYLLSGDRPKLIYVKNGGSRDPQLTAMLHRIQADDGASYKHFDSADELADLLADDLAVLLTERFTGPGPAPAAPGLRPARLPVPLTPIVGRAVELATLRAVLAEPDTHLVTLLGPGGIGKTRLALEVAEQLTVAGGLDGTWFVDLSAVTDPALWVDAVAAALGVRPEGAGRLLDVLVDRLQGRRVLLVLDNFEQVASAAPQLTELLAACPEVTALVTSRAVLRVRGERVVAVEPLGIPPDGGRVDLEALSRSAAVQLFVARARDVRPGFAVTAANAPAVAQLSRRLDGIPLALELAAAQLRMLSPAVLLRRLGDRLDRSLDLAAGPVDLPRRQRTLRATVEWSHSLLTETERTLLARLSVFAGSWTLDGAEAVGDAGGGGADVLDTMSSLVAQSLVSSYEVDTDEPRFRLLETVRAYARERLAERGETDATTARLAAYLRAFVEDAGAGLAGPANREWAARVDSELPDLRAVTAWAVAGDDAELVVRLAAPLFTYWWGRGLLATMRTVAEQAAALPSADLLPPDAAALLVWARGMSRISGGDLPDAQPLLQRLLDAAVALGDDRLRAHALVGLGMAVASEDAGRTAALLDEAVGLFRRTGDGWGLAYALAARGQFALLDGDPGVAAGIHLEALGAAERIDNDHLRAQLLDLLGLDAIATGDVEQARERFGAAARLHIDLLDQEGSANCLDGFAGIAMVQGRPAVAARLLGASAHARDVVGVAVWPGLAPLAEMMLATVSGALGEAAFDRARADGAAMRTADALAYGHTATAPGAESAAGPAPGTEPAAGPAPGTASAADD